MASHFAFEAIGTHWEIDIYETLSAEQESVLLSLIEARIAKFDATYSRFRSDSLVTKISQEAGEYPLPDDAEAMLSLYHDLYTLTGGLLTPFMGQVMSDAGYDAHYSLQQSRPLSAPPQWDDVMEYRAPVLKVKKPFLFDFGAAGKGYLIDIVGEVLQEQDIKAYCIDAGGDMRHRNDAVLRVGLEHPDDSTKVIGVVELQNKSLCGSAGNRRKWANFHHIINPHELTSATEVIAVWVMADSTMLSDAIATCLFFVKYSVLNKYQFEYLLIRKDYSVEQSGGFVMVQ